MMHDYGQQGQYGQEATQDRDYVDIFDPQEYITARRPLKRRRIRPIVLQQEGDYPAIRPHLRLPVRQKPASAATPVAPAAAAEGKQADEQQQPAAAEACPPQQQGQARPAVEAGAQSKRSRKQTWSGRGWRRRRVRPLTQMNVVECGYACLAMILNYYGRPTSVSELRMRHGLGRDGLSALSIVKAARSYGLRTRAISLQRTEDFQAVPLPAVVHWEFKHFIVVERWTPRWVEVIDPAWGRKRLTPEEFDAGFTGIVILFEPGVHFSTEGSAHRVTLWMQVKQFARQTRGALLQVLGASLFLQLFGLLLPLLTKIVIDQILPAHMVDIMGILGLGLLLLLATQATTTILREWLLVYLRARVDIQLVLGFFEHLLTLPFSFFQQRSSGDLLQRLGSNTIIRDTLSNQLISTLLDSGTVIAYLFILLWQSPIFALLTLGLGLLQVLVLLGTHRIVLDLASRDLAAQGKAQGYLAETLAGMATLKAAGAEQRALERWSNLFYERLNITLRLSYLQAGINTAMTILRIFSPIALLWIGAYQVLNGHLSVGTMLALNTLASAFLTPVASLVSSGQQFQILYAHLERLTDVTTAEPEQDIEKAQLPPRLSGRIYVQNVSFQYGPDSPRVLKQINIRIEPGQKIAIVGRTGSGKSTLGKLLLALYTPTEGEIYYDGLPLSQLNYQEVRRQFGVVLQDSQIFSGSILQNITLNDPNVPYERIVKAATAAAIHEDIMRMPLGYDTPVAEGGSALSGGQRQRLCLARALVNEPAILLLDEATSHLDVLTEQRVSENLRAYPCTQIIIAHRLSTIRDADLILVMHDGMIIEQGTHEQLLQLNGYYAQLMRQQLEQEERQARAGAR
ncbi:NHLP family bacteriocin export ABC transporter peptidase/permease/ATPase [Thermogemmatispora aurantia]|uniref:NHLP family bacteriocin export ABC transporter peptidase/permease/ATPase n=1 Tax=Thermogemmatispora aurantia TaxID=2045279 RepID=A0A5J4K5F4_9CHLR|nr:peptidase domain-containing ABC transporter [Thermogemmatispora aurantia]GER81920.1 NHLP family bacteriocin export ABC transporter peptidase/permease/ATPase [Thermogemmatispora aurantia]